MRRTLAAAVFTALSIATAGAQLTIPKEYLPKVHGTIRSKYELQTTTGMQRFQVRNARVSLDGKVLPVIAYKAEIDLSDEGSIKMLDAYARFVPNDTWNLTMGQMRVPFTIDAHRSPHQQYFANRFVELTEGEKTQRIEIGLTGSKVVEWVENEESYLLGTTGQFAENEDGELVLKLEFAFLFISKLCPGFMIDIVPPYTHFRVAASNKAGSPHTKLSLSITCHLGHVPGTQGMGVSLP